MTTRRERQEKREFRQRMKAKYPSCRWCRKPCVAGQVDGEGQPAHFVCQLAFLLLSKPYRRAVPINPKLPDADQQRQREQHHRKETAQTKAQAPEGICLRHPRKRAEEGPGATRP